MFVSKNRKLPGPELERVVEDALHGRDRDKPHTAAHRAGSNGSRVEERLDELTEMVQNLSANLLRTQSRHHAGRSVQSQSMHRGRSFSPANDSALRHGRSNGRMNRIDRRWSPHSPRSHRGQDFSKSSGGRSFGKKSGQYPYSASRTRGDSSLELYA